MGDKRYTRRGPGGTSRPGGRRGNAGSSPISGTGGTRGGRAHGTNHIGGTGTSSSSVHDGIAILVTCMAAAAVLLVGTPVAVIVYAVVTGA